VHEDVEQSAKNDADGFDHLHAVPTTDREDPCQVFQKNQLKNNGLDSIEEATEGLIELTSQKVRP
jgi:hypothetical protein